jgi:hypothetical protein
MPPRHKDTKDHLGKLRINITQSFLRATPFLVSPKGEMMVLFLPPWGKVRKGVIDDKDTTNFR